MIPAISRRPMIPSTFATATPRISSPPATVAPTGTFPSRNDGSTTWSVAQPTAQAEPTVIIPYSALPTTAPAKIRGSVRIATPSTPMPRTSMDFSPRAAV